MVSGFFVYLPGLRGVVGCRGGVAGGVGDGGEGRPCAVFRRSQVQCAGDGQGLFGVARREAGVAHGEVGVGELGMGVGFLVAQAAAAGHFDGFLEAGGGDPGAAVQTLYGPQGDQGVGFQGGIAHLAGRVQGLFGVCPGEIELTGVAVDAGKDLVDRGFVVAASVGSAQAKCLGAVGQCLGVWPRPCRAMARLASTPVVPDGRPSAWQAATASVVC